MKKLTIPAAMGLCLSASLALANVDSINVNEAGADRLEALTGVGPATANAIIEEREMNGPFESVDALLRVPGIGDSTLEELREQATVD